jgi:hypothetical protein
MLTFSGKFSKPSTSNEFLAKVENNNSTTSIILPKSCSVSPNYSCSNESIVDLLKEPTVNKKRGRKRKAQPNDNSVSSQYLDMKQKIASISSVKKVKTTKELLEDLQNRKIRSDSVELETQSISNIDGPKASPISCTGECNGACLKYFIPRLTFRFNFPANNSPLDMYKNDKSNNETKLEVVSKRKPTKPSKPLTIEEEIASILAKLPPLVSIFAILRGQD